MVHAGSKFVNSSWFSKVTTGEANRFDVEEINLDTSTTTDELLSEINALNSVDSIQLTWPLPDHIILEGCIRPLMSQRK